MDEIRKVLLERLDALKKSYTDYHNNPYDPKTAHRIRTSSRKLRSLLNFLKKKFDAEEYQRLNGELKGLALVYGPVRETDVLIELCAGIALNEPDMSAHYRELFDFLHKERLKEMRRTFNKTKTRTAQSALERVEASIVNMSLEDGSDWDSYIKKRLVKKERRLVKAYYNVDMDEYEAVHEIRKKAKKLRFSAKYLGPLAPLRHKRIAKDAKRIQDEFGIKTDAYVNSKLLEAYAEKVDDEALKALFYKIGETQQKILSADHK